MIRRRYQGIYKPLPEVGDLIRSTCTPNFINLVLAVSEPIERESENWRGQPVVKRHVIVRSVRYASVNKSVMRLLKGTRIVPFKFAENSGRWSVVEPYTDLSAPEAPGWKKTNDADYISDHLNHLREHPAMDYNQEMALKFPEEADEVHRYSTRKA